MKVHIGLRGFWASLGLTCAAVLWAVNTQLGEVLPYPACRQGVHYAGFSSAAALVLAIIGGLWSWRVYRRSQTERLRPVSTARGTLQLAAGVGAGAAALFAFSLILQASAGFILTGCER